MRDCQDQQGKRWGAGPGWQREPFAGGAGGGGGSVGAEHPRECLLENLGNKTRYFEVSCCFVFLQQGDERPQPRVSVGAGLQSSASSRFQPWSGAGCCLSSWSQVNGKLLGHSSCIKRSLLLLMERIKMIDFARFSLWRGARKG